MASQFFLKTNQDIELFHGYPEFNQLIENSTVNPVISSVVSPCGRFLAISTKEYFKVFSGPKLDDVLFTIQINDVYDLIFSPSGNYLSTWERPAVNDENHQNVKVWYLNKLFESDSNTVETPVFEYKHKSQASWSLQFSNLDNYAIKTFNKELRIIKLDQNNHEFNFEKPFATLSQENDSQFFSTYLISPADHPTICTFTPEKSGKPAQLTIWPILEGKITKKIATKNFFKADSCQLQWNPQGNAILCLAITDFDAQNKSYYGENTLYLLSFQGVNGTLGGSSVRVPLTNGPVHDFTWSPTSRQFGVIAGYMPATISFFDLRGNVIHSLPKQSKNTMLFSPSGRYILIGGFGNLQGSVEILDRHNKFKSITQFDATNTSVCKWSPGGEFIMTATTSPRLRVDNGIKIWHVTGSLVFIKEFKELLKVDWRSPCKYKTVNGTHVIKDWQIDTKQVEEINIDPILTNKSQLKIHESVTEYHSKHPHKNANAVGTATSGAAKPKGAYKPPHARRTGGSSVPGAPAQKTVPGYVPGAASKAAGAAKPSRRRKNNNAAGTTPSTTPGASPAPAVTSTATAASPEEKKIRSLLKKLRSIETLKQRQANGDKLEDTQVLKITTEDKVLKELEALGWTEES